MLADLLFKNNTQIDWSLLLLTLGCSFCFLSLFFSCPTRVTGLFITRCLSECVEAPPHDRWFMGTPIELSVLSQVSRNWHSAWVKKKIVTSLWNTARWWPCWSQDPSYWHKSAFLGSQMKPDQVEAKVTLKTYDVYTWQRRQPFLRLGSSVHRSYWLQE